MRGGKNKNSFKGYTVIEVMIFLAVSGFMFIVAANAISGKQASAEFKQGMNQTNEQIRQIMNDVANGQYPSSANFTCTAGGSGSPTIVSSPTNPEQGSNQGCAYIGKIVRFSRASGGSNGYAVSSIAGRQFVSSGISSGFPTSIAESSPVLVDSSKPDYDQHFDWGLQYTNAFSASGVDVGATGFIKSYSTSGGGGQDVMVFLVPRSSSTNAGTILQYIISHPTPTTEGVTLCFGDGGSRYGTIQIGGSSGGQLHTTQMQISSTKTTGCL